MPRKTKKQRQSTNLSQGVTTENSAGRVSDHALGEPSSLNDLLTMPGDALDGTPNLTVGQFCQWVNDVLLPTNAEMIDPEFRRNVSTETARKWMKKLGF